MVAHLMVRFCVPGALLCRLLQAPARSQDSLMLSLPGVMWARARSLHFTRIKC